MTEHGTPKNILYARNQILRRYYEEISVEKPLTPEEEIQLASRVKKGDNEALDKLLHANLRFVVSVAKKYQNRGLSLEDLINEGNIGLIKAARRFDETRGFKFISYAVWWIRQTILQSISENSRLIRLPLNIVGSLNKISKLKSEFERDYEREPTYEEIETIIQSEHINPALTKQLVEGTVSMDSPIGRNERGTLIDILPGPEETDPGKFLSEESFREEVNRALSSLNKREAIVIRMYFGIGRDLPSTLEEIGKKLNVTRERVRQIKEKALRKLRNTSREIFLKRYLG